MITNFKGQKGTINSLLGLNFIQNNEILIYKLLFMTTSNI